MKKKILFVNDEMTMGGVARILNTFLNKIDSERYDVDVLVLHKRGELLSEIPSGINVIGGTPFFNTIDIPLKSCKLNNIFSKLRLIFYMKTGLIKNKIATEQKKVFAQSLLHMAIAIRKLTGFKSTIKKAIILLTIWV